MGDMTDAQEKQMQAALVAAVILLPALVKALTDFFIAKAKT